MTRDVKASNLNDTSACASVHTVATTQSGVFFQPHRRHTRSYLGLHKLGVVLVDLHLFDLLFAVLCVQQAVGFQHLNLILQVSNVALQRGDFGVLRTKTQSRHTSQPARRGPQVACCQMTLSWGDGVGKKRSKKNKAGDRQRERLTNGKGKEGA